MPPSRFGRARRAALMDDLLGHLVGRTTQLLPFEEVRRSLRLRHLVDRGLREIPLERIVGTLGRGREFNRTFLPRTDQVRDRWQTIERMVDGLEGFSPIEVYQVGEAYFVIDGHHRVSVLRSQGATTVEAWVKEFPSAVPLHPQESLEDVLLKRGLAGFLESTHLKPGDEDEFVLTCAGGYEHLLEHISGHGYFRGLEENRALPWHEAVQSWYERVYRPTTRIIRESGALEAFPGRTVSDLYLFTMDHLHELRQRYGDADPAQAVAEVSEQARRKR